MIREEDLPGKGTFEIRKPNRTVIWGENGSHTAKSQAPKWTVPGHSWDPKGQCGWSTESKERALVNDDRQIRADRTGRAFQPL